MRFFSLISIVIILSAPVYGSVYNVATELGFNANDNTNFLQFALQETTADTVLIPDVGQDWITGPLRVERDDFTLLLAPGVVLRALPGAYGIFQPMFRLVDRENITIAGYGAEIVMNRQEYINLADSEYRHGIQLGSATNVIIEGLTIRDTGGDAVLITKSFQPGSAKNYSENIIIRNCRFTNNYRQGISITSVKNAQILNCELSATSGTLPEAGIDIEPDDPEERIEDVLIDGCRIFDNFGSAIQIAVFQMNDDSRDISVTVSDTYMANNHDPSNEYVYAEIAATDNDGDGVDGYVEFINCYVASSQWSAVYINKTVESYDLRFDNCIFKNVSQDPIAFNCPIFFEVTDYDNQAPRFGGASFTDCTLIYDQDIPFLDIFEWLPTSPGLGNVTGNFLVVNPNMVDFRTGDNPENVTIDYQYASSLPATTVGISAIMTDFPENEGAGQFTLTRTGALTFPMAVEVAMGGQATYGMDYDRHPLFGLFPTGVASLTIPFGIAQDDASEGVESLEIDLVASDCYTLAPNAELQLSISDGGTLPVGWLTFSATPLEKAVALHWATASEMANAGFSIQRSRPEGDWLTIGRHPPNLTEAGAAYSYLDEEPYPGLNQYRIKQTDYTGAISYSTIQVVAFRPNSNRVFAYPNPVREEVFFKGFTGVGFMCVYDNNGRLLQRLVQPTEQDWRLNVHDYPPGTYRVLLYTKDAPQPLSTTFIKSE